MNNAKVEILLNNLILVSVLGQVKLTIANI